ncbi:hypothetical protein Ga0466249_001498 [Sporomusaceae bacterium BoRhaA]|nr:hypothetical protein [Pelorhabdus rhamnosifermentans]
MNGGYWVRQTADQAVCLCRCLAIFSASSANAPPTPMSRFR